MLIIEASEANSKPPRPGSFLRNSQLRPGIPSIPSIPSVSPSLLPSSLTLALDNFFDILSTTKHVNINSRYPRRTRLTFQTRTFCNTRPQFSVKMRFFQSALLAVSALASVALAQSSTLTFTNVPASVAVGKSYTIEWKTSDTTSVRLPSDLSSSRS